MKNIFMVLVLFSSTFLQAGCDADPVIPDSACAVPSQYVFQFLARSGTLYRGSHEWLKALSNNKTVKTNYLATNGSKLLEYAGAMVFLHDLACKIARLPVDTVKAKFEVTRAGDDIKVTSHIENTIVKSGEEAAMALFVAAQLINHTKDRYTACIYKVSVDEANDKELVKVVADCETKMTFDEFMNVFIYSKGRGSSECIQV